MYNSMQAFALWFLSQIPDFLMSEPICYLFGIIMLTFIIKIIFGYFKP